MRQAKWLTNFYNYVKLSDDVDKKDIIHDEIEQDLVFKGSKLWLLVFSIIVASVGLNMNSTAVVIGAMLISPLMGPINGLGYGIATYNFILFKRALKNFIFAIVAGLIASTIYFALSPIDAAYSEIIQRTSPSIYDVIIAFFGGTAGMIAISSRHKGNVLPGVAIATALIPPLCTAGYGLATAQFTYFFGALYLFTINSVFIALSALIISQLLKFPIRKEIDEKQKTKINRYIYLTIFIVLIPSIYFGYALVQKEKFVENASSFIQDIRIVDGNYLLKNEILPKTKTIVLTYGGTTLSKEQKRVIRNKTKHFDLDDVTIEFDQGLNFNALTKKGEEAENLKSNLSQMAFLVSEKDKQIDSLQMRKYLGRDLLKEVKALFPQIVSCSYTDSYSFSVLKEKPERIDIVVFKIQGKALNTEEQARLNQWIKTRLNANELNVYYE